MAGYTHEVRFSKTFKTGNLKGLTVEGSFRVCDIKTAQNHVRGMLTNPENTDCVTRSKFVYVYPYIVALD